VNYVSEIEKLKRRQRLLSQKDSDTEITRVIPTPQSIAEKGYRRAPSTITGLVFGGLIGAAIAGPGGALIGALILGSLGATADEAEQE
jgi:hypothetical protein